MAYDESLARRIRTALIDAPAVTEKKMFGGIAFLQRGHMAVGVSGSALMARVGKPGYADALAREHVRVMDFTGRPLGGYVYVDPPGIASDAQLGFWLRASLDFVATLPPKVPKLARPAGARRVRT